jgi:opacity protein-like surface antigen
MNKICIILLFLFQNAIAQDKFYIGASSTDIEFDSSVSGLTGSAKLDEDDRGRKFFIGYQTSKNFGFEFHRAIFGDLALTGTTGDQFISDGTAFVIVQPNSEIKSKVKSYGAALTYNYPIHEKVSIFAKAGLHRWKVVTTDNYNGDYQDENGLGLLTGIGTDIHVFKKLNFRLDYEKYEIDSDDVDDIDSFSVGLKLDI